MRSISTNMFLEVYYDEVAGCFKEPPCNTAFLFYVKDDNIALANKVLLESFFSKGKFETVKVNMTHEPKICELAMVSETGSILYVDTRVNLDMSVGPQNRAAIKSYIDDMCIDY